MMHGRKNIKFATSVVPLVATRNFLFVTVIKDNLGEQT